MAKKKKEFNFHQFLVSVLRASFKKTPMYKAALDAAKEEYFEPSKTGKPMRRVRYICAECGRRFREYLVVPPGQKPSDVGLILDPKSKQNLKKKFKMIAVDHVDPIINPSTGFAGWGEYIEKLYYGRLQVLCNYPGEMDGEKSCHYKKTQDERARLRETKKKQKESK